MHKLLPGLLLFLLTFLHSGCGEKFIPGAHKNPYDGMEEYQKKLEAKLLRQHQNHPVHGSRVSRVKLEVSKDIQVDVAGKQHKVEWAQLVYDNWGNRIPELEREFFVVVFSKPGDTPETAGRRHNIKPSLTVGMKAMGVSGEHRPVTALVKEGSSIGLYCPSCGQASQATGVCTRCLEKNSAEAGSIHAPVAPAPSALSPSSRAQQGIPSSVRVELQIPVRPASPVTGQGSLTSRLVPPAGSALNSNLDLPRLPLSSDSARPEEPVDVQSKPSPARQGPRNNNTVQKDSPDYTLPVNHRSLGGMASTELEEIPVNQVALPEDSSPASYPSAEISVTREAIPEEDLEPVVLDRF